MSVPELNVHVKEKLWATDPLSIDIRRAVETVGTASFRQGAPGAT